MGGLGWYDSYMEYYYKKKEPFCNIFFASNHFSLNTDITHGHSHKQRKAKASHGFMGTLVSFHLHLHPIPSDFSSPKSVSSVLSAYFSQFSNRAISHQTQNRTTRVRKPDFWQVSTAERPECPNPQCKYEYQDLSVMHTKFNSKLNLKKPNQPHSFNSIQYRKQNRF